MLQHMYTIDHALFIAKHLSIFIDLQKNAVIDLLSEILEMFLITSVYFKIIVFRYILVL